MHHLTFEHDTRTPTVHIQPLKDEHTGASLTAAGDQTKQAVNDANKQRARKALWERLVSDRAAAADTYRFQERLKVRAAAFHKSGDEDPVKTPGILRPGIRQATLEYFMTPPEEDFTLAAAAIPAGMLALYIYTIFHQGSGILKAPDHPFIYNRFLKLSSRDTLWAFFLFKEFFFFSLPLFYLVAYTILAVLGLVVSPLLIGFYFVKVRGKGAMAEKNFRTVLKVIKNKIDKQLLLFGSLVLNLSSCFRMALLADQLLRRRCNASVKDFGLVLTTVANIVFDLVLITMLGDDRVKGDSSKQFFSLAVNLVNLMKVITGQQLILHNLTDAFRDINEHRLSKFEFALLMVKIQEQLLEDDIQYNFVEHLYSGPQIPLTPHCEPLQNVAEDKDRIAELMPDLPEALAVEFGHDGLHGFDDQYTGDAKLAANLDSQLALFKKRV